MSNVALDYLEGTQIPPVAGVAVNGVAGRAPPV